MTVPDQPGVSSGVRYVLTAGPGDVGHRVVVRRRRPDGALGDLLGELLRWDDQLVEVRDRHGVTHPVATSDVVAAKRVPPAPPRRG